MASPGHMTVCTEGTLDLELKHICLLLGQLGHFFPYCLDEGSRGDVGERRVGGVVVGQAVLGGGGGGQRGLLQAGVQAALLAVLPGQPGWGVVLVAGPRVSLDVARQGHLQRIGIAEGYAERLPATASLPRALPEVTESTKGRECKPQNELPASIECRATPASGNHWHLTP